MLNVSQFYLINKVVQYRYVLPACFLIMCLLKVDLKHMNFGLLTCDFKDNLTIFNKFYRNLINGLIL